MKGRLPLNHSPIDQAFQNGLRECLRSLQVTNPELLLTPQQLRRVEREARYVPAVAWALSSILCKTEDNEFQERLLTRIGSWREQPAESQQSALGALLGSGSLLAVETSISPLLEQRLKLSVAKAEEARKEVRVHSKRQGRKGNQSDEEDGYNDDLDNSGGEEDGDTSNAEEEVPSTKPRAAVGQPLSSRVQDEGYETSAISSSDPEAAGEEREAVAVVTNTIEEEDSDSDWW
jgi:hypothetical protein